MSEPEPEQPVQRFVTRTGLFWELLPPRPLDPPAEVTVDQAMLYASARYMRGLLYLDTMSRDYLPLGDPPPPYSVPPGSTT